MPTAPKRHKANRDVVSTTFGLLLIGAGAYGIWDVFLVLEQARSGKAFILGGVGKSTVITFLILLWGLKMLILGHGPPPPRPGETRAATPIRNAIGILLFVAALAAGIGLKVWADAELEALGYERKSLFDG
ncbi:MAG: hypothetical protein ACOY82_12020 [Pseudomonadota bacterium]